MFACFEVLHIGDDWECDVMGALDAGARAMWLSKNRDFPEIPRAINADRLYVVTDITHAADLTLALVLEPTIKG